MDKYNPEYVLILSADHIYKMNYKKMLDAHKASNADLTIAVLEVPWDEAPRFGIMNTNPDGSVYEFEEKPKNPKSNLASMGIYIFSYDKLKKYLIEDEKVKRDEHDFGKDIIPAMIRDNCKLFAYKFEGYWKDVGTVHSLWQANMDLLESKDLDLYGEDSDWKVYSEDTHSGPQFISSEATIEDSMINQGCRIEGTFKHSVVFGDVTTCFKYINFPFAKGTDGTKIINTKDDRIPAILLYQLLKDTKLPNIGFARHYMFLREINLLLPPKNICNDYYETTKGIMDLRAKNIEPLGQCRLSVVTNGWR